ncbi:hypothetical protein DFH09DRAFT_1125479, partial [Mycena vulgaris]
GAGGNVVANRLIEDSTFSVLLLEAGPSPEGRFNYTNYTVTSIGLNTRVLTYPRRRILGGSTSINGLGYVRGSKDDYDAYARVTEDPDGWDALQPYFRKNERWTAPTDNHNQTGQFNPKFHDFHGINSVSLPDIDNRVAGVVQELGEEFPFNEYINSGSLRGISWVQSNIRHGKRSSSFTSYLGPDFIDPTRVVQTAISPSTFSAIEFASGRDVSKDSVIISAGALETPKLLMKFGIGDMEYLSSMGITPLVILPDVGKNLSAHLAVCLVYSVNSTQNFDEIVRNVTLPDELLAYWIETGGAGPLGITYTSHDIFATIQVDILYLTTGSPLILKQEWSHQFNTRGEFSEYVASLNTDFNIFGLREAVKMTHRFLNASAWQGYILKPLRNLEFGATDDEIETYLRQNDAPNGHIVGTASMSAKGAHYGVVDPDLTVKGVRSSRIVDASVLPYLPTGFTMTTTYIVAERPSDMIKAAWK